MQIANNKLSFFNAQNLFMYDWQICITLSLLIYVKTV